MIIDSIFVFIIAIAIYRVASFFSEGMGPIIITMLFILTMSTGWRLGQFYNFIDNTSCAVTEYVNDPGFFYWLIHPQEYWRCHFSI